MTPRNATSIVGASVWLAALGALQCNQVLGIDAAELDDTIGTSAGGTGTGGKSSGGTGTVQSVPDTDPPAVGCIEPKTECTSCFSSCAGFDMQGCMANPKCRKALDGYRTCLGDGCGAMGEAEGCREKLSADPDGDVQALVACLSTDACVAGCARSPLVRMCELYCACMVDNCGSRVPGGVSACMTDCLTLNNADLTYCRKMHCEFLELPNSHPEVHCEHAMGMGQCAGPIMTVPGCDKIYPGFPCQAELRGDDCCSGVCTGEVCQ